MPEPTPVIDPLELSRWRGRIDADVSSLARSVDKLGIDLKETTQSFATTMQEYAAAQQKASVDAQGRIEAEIRQNREWAQGSIEHGKRRAQERHEALDSRLDEIEKKQVRAAGALAAILLIANIAVPVVLTVAFR